jgi:radical SAM protein with 4Fe4S-binding SPASM domain
MCLSPISERVKRHLTFEEFKKIIDSIYLLRKISLVGSGEPLLNPDLFKMIAYAKAKGITIGFATNGLLLNKDKCREIIDSRLDWINISVDSIEKSVYESIRRGAKFEELIENTRCLMELKGMKVNPEVSLWFAIMRRNLTCLSQMLKFASDLGIKQVSAQFGHDWGSKELKKVFLDNDLSAREADVIPVLKQSRELARKYGIRFEYINIPDKNAKRICKWPWKSCYITSDGFVTPCCVRGADPEILNFGNVFEESFTDIWNNKKYQDFRRKLSSKDTPGFCISCPSYYKRLKV